ncbi:MAG: transposase [Pseudomonadota bacterium]|nr:transposase [Pseudomonadota bacterium]
MLKAQISHDRFHVVALAGQAMVEVRTAEWKQDAAQVQVVLEPLDTRERCSLL